MRGPDHDPPPPCNQPKANDDTPQGLAKNGARRCSLQSRSTPALTRRARYLSSSRFWCAKARETGIVASTPKTTSLDCDCRPNWLRFSLALPETAPDTAILKDQKPATRPLDPFQRSRRPAGRPAWGAARPDAIPRGAGLELESAAWRTRRFSKIGQNFKYDIWRDGAARLYHRELR